VKLGIFNIFCYLLKGGLEITQWKIYFLVFIEFVQFLQFSFHPSVTLLYVNCYIAYLRMERLFSTSVRLVRGPSFQSPLLAGTIEHPVEWLPYHLLRYAPFNLLHHYKLPLRLILSEQSRPSILVYLALDFTSVYLYTDDNRTVLALIRAFPEYSGMLKCHQDCVYSPRYIKNTVHVKFVD
jgi:hypothetical protein